jgi:hypothetical protein
MKQLNTRGTDCDSSLKRELGLNPQASNWLIDTKKDELFLTILTLEP